MGGTSSQEFDDCELISSIEPTSVLAGGRYISSEPRSFFLKEKVSLSGDDFDVRNERGDIAFKMEGKVFSFKDKKVLLTADGTAVGKIKEKSLTMHGRLYIMDENDLVRVVMRKSHVFQFASEAEAWILRTPLPYSQINKNETKNRVADFRLLGNWRAKKFLVVPGNLDSSSSRKPHCYAKIQPGSSLELRNLFLGRDSYTLTVAPNFDCCLAVMMTVAIDELFRDHE